MDKTRVETLTLEYCEKRWKGRWVYHGSYASELHTNGPLFKQVDGAYYLGKKHGHWLTTTDTGSESIRWVRGQRHGAYRKLDDKQRLLLKGTYHRGKKHGTWTWYKGKGVVEKRCRFDQGSKVTCINPKTCKKKVPACRVASRSGIQLAKLTYNALFKKQLGRCICLGRKALKTVRGWRVAATHYNVGQCWQRLGCTSLARDRYLRSVAKSKPTGTLLRVRCRALKRVGGKSPRCK